MYKLDGKAIIGMLKGDDGIDEVAESFGGYGRVASGELLKCKRLGLRNRDMSALKFFLFFGLPLMSYFQRRVRVLFTVCFCTSQRYKHHPR